MGEQGGGCKGPGIHRVQRSWKSSLEINQELGLLSFHMCMSVSNTEVSLQLGIVLILDCDLVSQQCAALNDNSPCRLKN